MEKQNNTFTDLNKIVCKVQKKGKFDYISWATCWKEVKTYDPNANFEVHTTEGGFPAFIKGDVGGFVKVSVTIKNQTHTEFYPIMNNLNRAEKNISVVEINNSIKRALVKACAYFGLGLKLYDGEELGE